MCLDSENFKNSKHMMCLEQYWSLSLVQPSKQPEHQTDSQSHNQNSIEVMLIKKNERKGKYL